MSAISSHSITEVWDEFSFVRHQPHDSGDGKPETSEGF
jgi:hypothetical protein